MPKEFKTADIQWRRKPGGGAVSNVLHYNGTAGIDGKPHYYNIKVGSAGNYHLWLIKTAIGSDFQPFKLQTSRSMDVVMKFAISHHLGDLPWKSLPTPDEMAYWNQAVPAKKLGLTVRKPSNPRPHAKGYKGKFAKGKR